MSVESDSVSFVKHLPTNWLASWASKTDYQIKSFVCFFVCFSYINRWLTISLWNSLHETESLLVYSPWRFTGIVFHWNCFDYFFFPLNNNLNSLILGSRRKQIKHSLINDPGFFLLGFNFTQVCLCGKSSFTSLFASCTEHFPQRQKESSGSHP